MKFFDRWNSGTWNLGIIEDKETKVPILIGSCPSSKLQVPLHPKVAERIVEIKTAADEALEFARSYVSGYKSGSERNLETLDRALATIRGEEYPPSPVEVSPEEGLPVDQKAELQDWETGANVDTSGMTPGA